MKRITGFIWLITAIAFLAGCAGTTGVSLQDVPTEKIYNVVFEGKPKIENGAAVVKEKTEIGKILALSEPRKGLSIAQVSVKPEFDDVMKSNVAFFANQSVLQYIILADEGEKLAEGDKVLGFTGKTQLYWYKTKTKVGNIVNATSKKARELYDKATK